MPGPENCFEKPRLNIVCIKKLDKNKKPKNLKCGHFIFLKVFEGF